MQLTRVLIANRGEIAVRIARAADEVGLESVAVYTEADQLALHPLAATLAIELDAGSSGADPVAAYLDPAALVRIAVETECDCVHPGYGFLSENAEFARLCAEAGLAFVGPSPEALALFGDKVGARALAESIGVPVIPGTEALPSSEAALAAVADVGYPVMLKAAAGGGGRGMRVVTSDSEMAEAFDRCSSEALASFGNATLFLERRIERPRHIEVQILADDAGNVVHLHERDCSVQLRNQKVIEVAPAFGLDADLRSRLTDDAVRLVQAAGYANAGTVEFLVAPETGEHFFIECNPRIQVEHTITEEVTGIDLVQTQFHITDGATLQSLGLGDQESIGAPRGFAVQARVVATGTGTISSYREPSGPGIRVDGAGYGGLTPSPAFDPLLAKVICSASGDSPVAAINRARRAVDEFLISGLPTNLHQLAAILDDPDVRLGDARTSLLAEKPELSPTAPKPRSAGSATVDFLRAQAESAAGGPLAPAPAVAQSLLPPLPLSDQQRAVTCPMGASVLEVRVTEGDEVHAGDTLLVVTAMKMETLITAPCDGIVAAVLPVNTGDILDSGQIVATLTPSEVATGSVVINDVETWAAVLGEVAQLRSLADERLAPGSEEPGVVRQRGRGKLNCRERIEMLLDDGSFREVGSLAGFASYDEDGAVAAFTPANHVGGQGHLELRPVIVCADDFTSRGGHADGAIGAKSFHLDRLSMQLGVPSIRLLDGSSGGGSVAAMVPAQKKEGESAAKESSGAIKAGRPRVSGGGGSFLPGHLGSTEYAEQLSSVPVVNMLLGSVVGIGAAKAVLGHFSVMVRDIAQLFVAGPPVVSHAMGYDITKEDLGDWRIHCTNGSVDNLAETEEEAASMARQFLSYLPSSVHEAPPVIPSGEDDATGRRDDELFTLVPRKRTQTFDIRRAIELMADRGSFFEIGSLWGTDQVTGFVRFDGHPVGVIASDSRHINGGALTADGCDKLRRHLDLCDLFHIPVLNLVDNPGFAVGLEHERAGTIRKGAEWMVAFAQVSVPIFTVLMRRSFGVAGNNYATPIRQPSPRVVWPAADVGGIPPEGGIEAAYKRQLAESEDPVALRAELEARIEAARGPIGPLNRFQMEEMIDPRDTRRLICEWIPTAYKIVSQPARLQSRPLGFRP
ncbi:MAG: carboxyl transferase domain-containing protein [Acidimicrobiales bacterium]